jgi:two-component system chemotaxis response regulator CheY
MKHIMIIDDSPTMRMSIKLAITNLNCEIEQAENGADALEKISALAKSGEDLALCISDVNMPVMDGITFVKEFRRIDRFTPILMLTTESGISHVAEQQEAGISGWMIKPFKADELVKTVGSLIV